MPNYIREYFSKQYYVVFNVFRQSNVLINIKNIFVCMSTLKFTKRRPAFTPSGFTNGISKNVDLQ